MNCNIIIEKCDAKREVLSDVYYGLYKGEAIALSHVTSGYVALFGPVYDDASKTEKVSRT